MALIRSHDALFRFVFGDPGTLAELLRAQLPAAAAAAIDWTSLRPADGAFVDEVLQERQTDLLFEVDLRGAPALLYVVCDHKSHDDHFTALQLLRYTVRILDRWQAGQPAARTLPIVLPIVVHHGERPWQAPRDVSELFAPADPTLASFLAPLRLRSGFLLVDVAAMDEAALDAMRLSAVGALTLRFLQFLRRSDPAHSATWIFAWRHLVAELLEQARGRAVLTALFSWFLAGAPDSHETLRTVMNRIDEENRPMRSALDLVLDMGREKGLQEGMRQGMQQGMQQGLDLLRRVLGAQLHARFGVLDASSQAALAAADGARLQTFGERLVTAQRLTDVFAA